MTRYRLNHDVVVDGAAQLVNERGPDTLSLAELAARFRVRTPSLYNHIQGLDGLRRDLALLGLRDLAARVQTATIGLAGRDALQAIATAYRDYAHENPGVYPYTLRHTEDADDELHAAGEHLLHLLFAALRGYKLPQAELVHAARNVRSAIHGFVSLETARGFGMPVDLDESYARLIVLLDDGLRSMSKSSA
ncbi:MAG: TetR/AcrR family transcriptional regulator [Caldilineaceae bacterium]